MLSTLYKDAMTPHLPTVALPDESASYLKALEEATAHFFQQQEAVMQAISPETLPLLEAIAALSTGGKRLRALLAYWGYRGAGGSPLHQDAIKAGLAIELFQTAALIHDDIIDASDTRRGAPSVHRNFEAMHRERHYKTDAATFGVSSAILAGDLCLSWSEMVFSSITSLTATSEARFIFDLMRTEVMAGQYLDVVGEVVPEEEPDRALERAFNVIRFKSAKYSCEHPLALGGALALQLEHSTRSDLLEGYRAFALPLGEGYQLRDDVLGVFGEPDTTGKPAGDDVREGKRTVLTAYTAQKATPEARKLLETSLGDPHLTAETITQLQDLMRTTGALDEVENLISLKSEQALTQLAQLPLAQDVRSSLETLALKALHRLA